MNILIEKRSEPSQKRSRERVERMLEVAGELLEEVGFDALTTKEIAARAEISIGAFYRFFPNKEAVVAELGHRHQARLQAYLDRVMTEVRQRDSRLEMADVVEIVEGVMKIYRDMPGFRVWSGQTQSGYLGEQTRSLREEVMNFLDTLLAELSPTLSVSQRTLCLTVIAQLPQAFLNFCEDDAPGTPSHPEMMGELKRIISLYLNDYLNTDSSAMPVD